MGTLALPGVRGRAGASARQASSRQSTSPGTDVVVVGAGAFGGWTALYLREMGVNVTMVDAYGAGNARASSGGETRQIRAAYGNQEYYTRWVLEAFARWKKRQAEWGRTLFFETGQISLVPERTKGLEESQAVLDRVGVKTEVLTRADLVRRYPQVNLEGINLGSTRPAQASSRRVRGVRPSPMRSKRKGGTSPSRGRHSGGRQAGSCKT